MACRGVLFALTDEEVARLRGAKSDDEVLGIVQDEIEQRWDQEHLEECDKAWEAIHRCLSDGTLVWGRGKYPLNRCILGGEQLHKNTESYVVSLVKPAEVQDIAKALLPINRDWLRERYFKIDQERYWVPLDEGDFEYTWDYFQGVRRFYVKAAADERHVIFTVDQ